MFPNWPTRAIFQLLRMRTACSEAATLHCDLVTYGLSPMAYCLFPLSKSRHGPREHYLLLSAAVRVLSAIVVVLAAAGCAGSLASRLTLPDRNTLVRDQLVIHSDFTLAAATIGCSRS